MERDVSLTEPPENFSPATAPLGTTTSGMPTFCALVFPHGYRQTAAREEESAYRTLPHNLEAEQGLLGALMLDNRVLERVSDLHILVHQRLYEVILKLVERGQMTGSGHPKELLREGRRP
jgi:DnaB-like helicase N terminal domain